MITPPAEPLSPGELPIEATKVIKKALLGATDEIVKIRDDYECIEDLLTVHGLLLALESPESHPSYVIAEREMYDFCSKYNPGATINLFCRVTTTLVRYQIGI